LDFNILGCQTPGLECKTCRRLIKGIRECHTSFEATNGVAVNWL
jgi:hypothetical protein